MIQWDKWTGMTGSELVRKGRNSFTAVYHFRDMAVCTTCGKSHAPSASTPGVSRAPAAVAPIRALPSVDLAGIVYLEVDPQGHVPESTRTFAEMHAANALQELAVGHRRVRWYREATADEKAALGLNPKALPIISSGGSPARGFVRSRQDDIWLSATAFDLDRASAARTATHEAKHLHQLNTDARMSPQERERDAEAFADDFMFHHYIRHFLGGRA